MRVPVSRRLQRHVVALALAVMLAAPGLAREATVTTRGQDVTIIEGREQTVYEFRQGGELRMIRVVPAIGRPYYLTPADPTRGYGNLEEADMLLPKWILIEF